MKIVIAGGTGQLGRILEREYLERGYEVIVLTRNPKRKSNQMAWDGKIKGKWVEAIENSDCVINLAGRSVNCRYTKENLDEMLKSRIDSTTVIGEAIRDAHNPPKLWLQMSTATIYSHRFDSANDELAGEIGGNEPNVPKYWSRSVTIAKAWEEAQSAIETPLTRKVAMRTAMVMSVDKGGIYSVLSNLTRMGLGGAVGGGQQYISWIHEKDFVFAIDFIIAKKKLSGPVNLCSPEPVSQRKFMKTLQKALKVPIALPATKWMAEIGAFFLRTDTELLLKSRRVIPARLLSEGFSFIYPEWPKAAKELVQRQAKKG